MKEKQINKLLQGVYNDFLEHISNESIKYIFKHKSFITGGCIPSMAMNEYVADYDIYLFDKESVDAVKSYFQNVHQYIDSVSMLPMMNMKYKVSLITENAINLTDKIQIITKYYGFSDDITDKFDFQHIKSFWRYNEGKEASELILCDDFYKLIHEKELVYTGSEYPLSSFFRTKKYIKKGWNISNATMLHIALDIVAVFNRGKIIINDKEDIKDYISATIVDIDDDEQDVFIDINDEHLNDQEEHFEDFDIDTVIQQLNGVDPVTIQAELEAYIGQRLSIQQIINLIK